MGLRLISIPTVGGIDICKSQFGNPQERSIYTLRTLRSQYSLPSKTAIEIR